jgi:hypothetical protein
MTDKPKILVNGQEVEAENWVLSLNRDYVDTGFSEMGYSRYQPGPVTISASFEDPSLDGDWSLERDQELRLYIQQDPSLLDRLLRREPKDKLLFSGSARMQDNRAMSIDGSQQVLVEWEATGPVTIYDTSGRLERWLRRLRWGLRNAPTRVGTVLRLWAARAAQLAMLVRQGKQEETDGSSEQDLEQQDLWDEEGLEDDD